MNQQSDPASGGDSDGASASSESESKKENDSTKPIKPETDKKEPTIHLDQFLKTCGVATGGQAKVLIQGGEVLVNDEVETRRRKQLKVGDEVTLGDVVYVVALNE